MSSTVKETDKRELLQRYIENLQRKTLGKQDIQLMKVLGFEDAYKKLDETRTKNELHQK